MVVKANNKSQKAQNSNDIFCKDRNNQHLRQTPAHCVRGHDATNTGLMGKK